MVSLNQGHESADEEGMIEAVLNKFHCKSKTVKRQLL